MRKLTALERLSAPRCLANLPKADKEATRTLWTHIEHAVPWCFGLQSVPLFCWLGFDCPKREQYQRGENNIKNRLHIPRPSISTLNKEEPFLTCQEQRNYVQKAQFCKDECVGHVSLNHEMLVEEPRTQTTRQALF
jgi:hypothetical protein